MPAGNEHRAGLAGAEILFADLPSVLARRDPQRHVVPVLHHDAVGRAVDPVLLGVAHDHEIVGADIAAAVALVQERHREFQHVDLAVAVDVLEHRSLRHRLGRDRPVGLHAVAIGAHHVERIVRHRQAERDGEPLRRIGRAGEQPHALGIARDLLEQDRRRLRPGVVHDLGQRAHFQLPAGALDARDLARALGARDEFAQIRVRPVVSIEAFGLALRFFQHGVSFHELFAVFCHAPFGLS